jgi:hypothetical protein
VSGSSGEISFIVMRKPRLNMQFGGLLSTGSFAIMTAARPLQAKLPWVSVSLLCRPSTAPRPKPLVPDCVRSKFHVWVAWRVDSSLVRVVWSSQKPRIGNMLPIGIRVLAVRAHPLSVVSEGFRCFQVKGPRGVGVG